MTTLIPSVLNKFLGRVHATSQPVLSAEQILRNGYNSTRDPSNQGAACFAPSVNMRFAADGSVTACCMNTENILGRYPEQSISEIWNSKLARGFREKMREYNFLSGCHVCTRDYNKGAFDQIGTRYFDTLPRHSAYPSMMEFLLSNTCNLECVMCTGDLSSSIRANRDKLPPIKSPYDEKFVEQLQEFIPHLKETRFSGAGEAFAIKINYTFWEMLIAQNPECRIVVQTNATILNARVKDFLNRGNFTIGISLDSLNKERYEAIRINASFDQVMKNVDYLAEYSR
ncbi:MAG TPA: radical SAM protein, partial [Chitinophagales bacterium]|nr:radical SAM protein [Chitinophagales bacterium]